MNAAGELIAGRYRIEAERSGAMGAVHLCVDRGDADRPVALKTLKHGLLATPRARERFLRESATWIGLGAHPNLVHALRVEYRRGGRELHLVLERVRPPVSWGEPDLRARLAAHGPLAPDDVLVYAVQVARGMRHATNALTGLVHGDLKPENLLVGEDGAVRVADFGLAQAGAGARGRQHGGTCFYMPPEQWTPGATLDARSDIYALGCVLYELLTGNLAVTGSPKSELAHRYPAGPHGEALTFLEGEHRRGVPARSAGATPEAARSFLSRCVAPDPSGRLADWGEVEVEATAAYRDVAGTDPPPSQSKESVDGDDRNARGWSLHALGLCALDLGRAGEAAGFFERALATARGEGIPGLEDACLGALGSAAAALGDLRRGEELLREAIARASLGGSAAELSNNLGALLVSAGRHGEAIPLLERALSEALAAGDAGLEADALGNLAAAAAATGNLEEAASLFREHLETARRSGDRAAEGISRGNLGAVLLDLGRPQDAMEALRPALRIARETGDRSAEAKVITNAAAAWAGLGDPKRAADLARRAREIAAEIGDRAGEAAALRVLGAATADLGRGEDAAAALAEAADISRGLGDAAGEALARLNLAATLVALRRPEEARPHAAAAEACFAARGREKLRQRAAEILLRAGGADR